MKKLAFAALIFALSACQEKVWYADLREKTIDTFCGTYEVISAEWGGDPIDLNNDGHASCDYLEEWSKLPSGIYRMTRFYSNGRVSLSIPKVNYDYSVIKIYQTSDEIDLWYDILFDDDEPYISFRIQEPVSDIAVTGYGEVEVTVEMSVFDFSDGLAVQSEMTPVTFKFKRCLYHK